MFLPEENKWPEVFAAAGLDVVPDPMVMRVADLFVGGKDFAVKSGLSTDRVWKAINENLDALIASFHILMTLFAQQREEFEAIGYPPARSLRFDYVRPDGRTNIQFHSGLACSWLGLQ
jgi:hypothetical protein